MVYIVLVGLLIGLVLLAIVCWKLMGLVRNIQTGLQEQNRDLLDRLMSSDIQTYSLMKEMNQSTTSTPSSTPYDASDEGEIKRHQDTSGLGQPMYDDVTIQDEWFSVSKDLLGGDL